MNLKKKLYPVSSWLIIYKAGLCGCKESYYELPLHANVPPPMIYHEEGACVQYTYNCKCLFIPCFIEVAKNTRPKLKAPQDKKSLSLKQMWVFSNFLNDSSIVLVCFLQLSGSVFHRARGRFHKGLKLIVTSNQS